jgi:hypothetical protein
MEPEEPWRSVSSQFWGGLGFQAQMMSLSHVQLWTNTQQPSFLNIVYWVINVCPYTSNFQDYRIM